MGLRQVTPPTQEPIILPDAKTFCKVDTDADDILLQQKISGAREDVENTTHRQILSATWELTLDAFPSDDLTLWHPPVQSITSVKYIDGNGVEQTVDPSYYELDLGEDPPVLRLAYGMTWPSPRGQRNAVRIRYLAGWATPALVPPTILAAIFLKTNHLYVQRDPTVIGTITADLPDGYMRLLEPWIVRGF